MFKNTRGFFLMSFASETEADTVLNLINIIVHNDEYSQKTLKNQLVWASYIHKKGKRMGLYSQKFVCLIGLNIKLYKSHTNYANGEEPSHRINLMDCDLSRDKKEIKFCSKNKSENSTLSIKLISEIERDDFVTLCAQTLGKALRKKKVSMNQQSPHPMSPSTINTTMASVDADDLFQDELSASDIEESFVEHEY